MLIASKGVRLSATVLVVALVVTPAHARDQQGVAPPAAPVVSKVEPPNWWVGLPADPMLLITGENLQQARLTTSYPGVKITRSEASPDGHYLFAWLELEGNSPPGTVPLQLESSTGSVTLQFPLRARVAGSGNFAGLSPNDIIYLIMPDRFADGDTSNDEPAPQLHTHDRDKPRAWHGGDLRGIRQHLSYLHQLGVTAIWLTPFWKNDWSADDFSYHGYHVVDFYSVDDHFGSLSDLQDLVTAAHAEGIRVVLDFVANHTGPHHPWVASPPRPDWFHGTPQKHLQPLYDFAPLTDPHASASNYENVLGGWFANKLPDLDPDEPCLAEYLLNNAIWWMEIADMDAVRLDTFPYSSRRFWSGWNKGILRTYPHLTTIGEVWDRDATITSFFEGGRAQFDGIDTGLSTVFDFPLQFALRDVLIRKQPVQKIIDVLQRDWLYPRPELLVTFFGNHDLKRFLSEKNSSRRELEAAFSLLLTMRGIPQLYYGDEVGLQGSDDPDNRRDFPGGFPGDRHNAFRAASRTPEEEEIFSHVQKWIQLRREHSALRGGRQWHIAWDRDYYAFVREDGEERVLVVFNNADTRRTLSLPLRETPLANARDFEPLLEATPARIRDGKLEVVVGPVEVAVYQVK